MGNLSDLFFGSIALKNEVLTPAQLSTALREQAARTRDGSGPTLGEVCRALGLLAEDEVNAILWAQSKSEVLLEKRLKAVLKTRPSISPPARPTIVPPAKGWAATAAAKKKTTKKKKKKAPPSP